MKAFDDFKNKQQVSEVMFFGMQNHIYSEYTMY